MYVTARARAISLYLCSDVTKMCSDVDFIPCIPHGMYLVYRRFGSGRSKRRSERLTTRYFVIKRRSNSAGWPSPASTLRCAIVASSISSPLRPSTTSISRAFNAFTTTFALRHALCPRAACCRRALRYGENAGGETVRLLRSATRRVDPRHTLTRTHTPRTPPPSLSRVYTEGEGQWHVIHVFHIQVDAAQHREKSFTGKSKNRSERFAQKNRRCTRAALDCADPPAESGPRATHRLMRSAAKMKQRGSKIREPFTSTRRRSFP